MFDDLSLADRHPILVFLREALAAAPEHGPEIAAATVRLAPSLAEAVTQTAVELLPDMADRLRAATSSDANSSEGEAPAFLAALTARLGERRVGELLSAVEVWQRQDNNRKAEGEPAVSFLTAMLAMILLASDTLADESNGAADATSTPSDLPAQAEIQTAALTSGEAALNGGDHVEGSAQGKAAAPNDASEASQGGEQTAQAAEPGRQHEVLAVQPAAETGVAKDQVAQSSEQDFRNFFSLADLGGGDIALIYDVDPLQNLPAGQFLVIENAPQDWGLSLDNMIAAGNLLIDPYA